MDKVLTLEEAAKFLQLHQDTVTRLALAGEIPGRKIGWKWRFSKAALERYLYGDGKESE